MTKVQVIHEQGPPDVMCWEDWPVPAPDGGEVRIRHTAIEVDFIDTRPGLMHYVGRRSDLLATAEALFAAIRKGILDAYVNYEYPLKDAVAAHQELESGTTLGVDRSTFVIVGKR